MITRFDPSVLSLGQVLSNRVFQQSLMKLRKELVFLTVPYLLKERVKIKLLFTISVSSPTISHESEERQDQEGRINSVASSGHLFCKKNIS